jgi:hypothetical protein
MPPEPLAVLDLSRVGTQTIEATPGIEIQGKRLPTSRLASNRHYITRIQRPTTR